MQLPHLRLPPPKTVALDHYKRPSYQGLRSLPHIRNELSDNMIIGYMMTTQLMVPVHKTITPSTLSIKVIVISFPAHALNLFKEAG